MDNEKVAQKLFDSETVRETAHNNGVDDAALHAIVDAIVIEVRGNLKEYVDMVCGLKWI